jgi:hypothetical protein
MAKKRGLKMVKMNSSEDLNEFYVGCIAYVSIKVNMTRFSQFNCFATKKNVFRFECEEYALLY